METFILLIVFHYNTFLIVHYALSWRLIVFEYQIKLAILEHKVWSTWILTLQIERKKKKHQQFWISSNIFKGGSFFLFLLFFLFFIFKIGLIGGAVVVAIGEYVKVDSIVEQIDRLDLVLQENSDMDAYKSPVKYC